jgi:hypothetical protein
MTTDLPMSKLMTREDAEIIMATYRASHGLPRDMNIHIAPTARWYARFLKRNGFDPTSGPMHDGLTNLEYHAWLIVEGLMEGGAPRDKIRWWIGWPDGGPLACMIVGSIFGVGFYHGAEMQPSFWGELATMAIIIGVAWGFGFMFALHHPRHLVAALEPGQRDDLRKAIRCKNK